VVKSWIVKQSAKRGSPAPEQPRSNVLQPRSNFDSRPA
jgi:hypothetical protein